MLSDPARPVERAEAVMLLTQCTQIARSRPKPLAGLRRRSVQWCIGARLMPHASHAWIEVGGHSVGEPEHADRPYHVLFRL